MKKLVVSAFLFSFAATAFAEKSPTLIGGVPVNPGEYPEVIYISMKNSRCSATVVGPRVVLTAAHCARQGAAITFQHGQTQFKGVCHAPPAYPNYDHDISLCLVDKDVPEPYATVAANGPQKGDKITMIGYGCTNPRGGGGNDGILRVGESTVTGFTQWDFVTKNGSALCYGDSGGPAFAKIADAKKDHHYVFGVNSKGDIQTTSYLSQVYSVASQEFFGVWSRMNSAKICGVNLKCDAPATPKVCGEAWKNFKLAHATHEGFIGDLERCLFKRTVSTCGEEVDSVRLAHVTMDDEFLKLTGCLENVEL